MVKGAATFELHKEEKMQVSVTELQQRRGLIRQLTVARMYSGISQEEMARRLGTHKSNISRLESGEQNISLDMFIRYAEALGKELNLTIDDPASEIDESMEYCLKLYDEELLRFTFRREGLRIYAEITNINGNSRDLLPLDMIASEDGIVDWLRGRILPGNREFAADILRCLRLEISDLKGIIDASRLLSLNDSYWVTPADSEDKFEDFNLYENYYDSNLTVAAFTGGARLCERFKVSPELTTGGQLRKAWRRYGENSIVLYKGGSEGFANTGNEPFSEYYASQIAECMGLNAVRYEIESWRGVPASKCKLFTDIDTAFIPASSIIRSGNIDDALEYYKKLGDDFYQELCSMLVFDGLICNEDRHFGNFGLLRDNRSGNIIAPAPIFDNGVSLFCYGMRSDFDNLERYAETRSNPYGISYQNLCRKVMGRKQKSELRKLQNFKFTRSDTIDIPHWRITAIEAHLQQRVQELLSLD